MLGANGVGVAREAVVAATKVREHASRAGLPADEVIRVADTVLVRPDPVPAA